MNISREKAEAVANALTKTLKDEVERIEKEAESTIQDFAKRNTPKELLDAWEKYPAWGKETKWESVKGIPLSHDTVIAWHKGEFRLDEATADKVTKLLYAKKDAQDKWKKVYKEIVATLLSLKTYNRCKEAFPEAYALLPNSEVRNLPVVQIDTIREQLGIPTHTVK